MSDTVERMPSFLDVATKFVSWEPWFPKYQSDVPDNVKVYLEDVAWPAISSKWLTDAAFLILQQLARCVSPIEQLMYLALQQEFDQELRYEDGFIRCNAKLSSLEYVAIRELGRTLLAPDEVDYQIDLTLYPGTMKLFLDQEGRVTEVKFFVGIECDGHDYHERTKEQAQKDKQKDRVLNSKGLLMLHFTGAEIFRDPAACARQVREAIDARVDEYKRIVNQRPPTEA